MSSISLQVSTVFAVGTTVDAYEAAGFSAANPTVSSVTSAAVDSLGYLSFTGLTPGLEYVAYATSTGRSVEFKMSKPSGDGRALVSLSDVDAANVTDGQVLAYDDTTGYWMPADSAAGGGYATVKDEGTSLTQRTILNFTGSGVSAADNAGSSRTDVTISSGYNTVQDEGSSLTQRGTINFVGSGVAATDDGSKTVVTISGTSAPDADATTKGLVKLAGDLGGTAALPTVPGKTDKSTLTTKGDVYVATAASTPARLAVGTDGQVLTADSAQSTGVKWATPSASSGYATVQDEGSGLTQRATINFVGAGVTATDDAANSRTLVTISGGGSTGYATVQDEGTPVTQQTTLNFAGSAVTATDDGANSRTLITVEPVDADSTTKGVIKLTGDLGGTAASPTVPGLTDKTDKTTLTTKGDVYVATGASTPARLGVGTNGQILTADSAQSTGVKWADPATSYVTVQEEGTPVTQRATLNFVGSFITAADNAGSTRTDVTVSVPDADGSTNGIVRLTGDLGGTASSPTVPNLIPKTTATTKGDILAASAASTVTRLGVGSDGQVLTAASGQSTGLQWAAPPAARTTPTFAIAGTVSAATIPGFFVSIPSGRTKKLLKCRYVTSAGTADFRLQKNGADITGFGTSGTPLSASTTATTTDPTDVTLAEDDYITLLISAVSSGADLTVTLVLEEA